MHTFKMLWDTMGSTEKHRDLSEGAREEMKDMRGTGTSHRGSGTSWGTRKETGPCQFFLPNYEDRLVVGHHRGVLGQVGVPCGVHGRHKGLQDQVWVLGWIHGRHGGLRSQVGVLSGVLGHHQLGPGAPCDFNVPHQVPQNDHVPLV
jgi:hypothetical protein